MIVIAKIVGNRCRELQRQGCGGTGERGAMRRNHVLFIFYIPLET